MINGILEGISIALNKEFGDGYTIYTESVEQGLKEPCFFVSCIAPTFRHYFDKRYFSTNKMCIQFIPESQSLARQESNVITERLFSCLEYIKAGDDLIRGTGMRAEMVDEILNFFVSYDYFVKYEEVKQTAMEKVDSKVGIKNG